MAKIDDALQKILDQRLPANASPQLGVWNSNLLECKKLADKQGIPLLAVWSNNGCAHCEILEKAFNSNAWKNWMIQQKYLFCFTCSLDEYAYNNSKIADDTQKGTVIPEPPNQYSYYKFCKYPTGITSYPFVKAYWKQDGKYVRNFSVHGDKLDRQQGISQGSYDKAGNYCIDWMLNESGFATYKQNEKYSITFNSNGGTLTSGMTRTVTENTAIGELPVPIRSGWTFNGWFTSASGGTQINAATVITANATYYAHWTEIPITPPTPDPPTPDPGQPQPPPTPGQPLKTMFGLCRDCTIITKDNKILQYSAAAQKITLVGDYSPNEFLAVSTKIT